MEKFICIHGHFYQPPRENAWLEEIELQESAAPYHDWNERIDSECYNPNANSRVLNDEGKIIDIVNNYSKISFNFGPTLLSWLEKYSPETYSGILKADKESMKNFGGHGSAMAQVYNHLIMPLCNRRDKETQVKWGIYDFEKRFKRKPEGMWLAETAVDYETLEVLAEHDIKFTVLAPRQAKAFRKIGEENWSQGVNSQFHYICNLPSGKKITLFFYDGDGSQAVAFKGLLKDGKELANNLINSFNIFSGDHPLVHIATDGESYGHHHRYGDMALAYCIRYIEENKLANLTNYGQFMNLFEAEYEIEIHENSSWSCVHGIERWRSNCGCNTGGTSWNQEWRKPLRDTLNWLRDHLAEVYEREMKFFNKDVWGLRNKFINIILDRNIVNVEKFIKENAPENLDEEQTTKFIRLMEMQRQCLLMFTSCAWFFDEISGIETVQVLQYANRAIQLAERESDVHLEEEFISRLSYIKSNIEDYDNGAVIYKRFVEPSRLTLTSVGMHYAVASLFDEEPESLNILSYRCQSEYFERFEAGIQKMVIGSTKINSKITLSEKQFYFVAIYLGQHHIIGSGTDSITPEAFTSMSEKLKKAFSSSSLAQVLQLKQHYIPTHNFSIRELFKDEQIKVLNKILEENIQQAEENYRDIYRKNYHLLNLMRENKLQFPNILRHNLEIVLNKDLEQFFKSKPRNNKKLDSLVDEFKRWDIIPYQNQLMKPASNHIIQSLYELEQEDYNIKAIERVIGTISACDTIGLKLFRRRLQNQIFKLGNNFIKRLYGKASIEKNEKWQLALIDELASLVGIKILGINVLFKV
jgi:alpha-amylase/alpha-mannosidase (GH57 family)